MRGFVAQGLLDVDGKGKSRLSAGRRLVRKYSDKKGLIRGVWGPHSVYACSREYLEKVAEESNGDLVHIHLSETRDEVNRCFGKEGMDPTAYLEDIGLLREGFVGAHGVHLDEEAIGRLRMHGCSLVTCPVSNLMLASGVAPLALASDLFSGIGTDGVASNNGTQFLQDVKTCALITKNAFGADCLPTGYFFDLATRKGAEMLDLNAGVVETGRLGDLALFSKELISWYPFYGKKGLLSHFVYSPPSQADTVVVAGEVVLENGRILGASEEEARKDIQEKVKDFREEYELV